MAWAKRKRTTLKSHEGQKRGKYGAIKCFLDGTPYIPVPGQKKPPGVYDSTLEARYAREVLIPMQRAGLITKIEPQVHLPLHAGNGKKVCEYWADFVLTFADGHQEIHEVKGAWTEVALLKVKWCALEYGMKPIIKTKHDF